MFQFYPFLKYHQQHQREEQIVDHSLLVHLKLLEDDLQKHPIFIVQALT
jgi:hypothetical protein